MDLNKKKNNIREILFIEKCTHSNASWFYWIYGFYISMLQLSDLWKFHFILISSKSSNLWLRLLCHCARKRFIIVALAVSFSFSYFFLKISTVIIESSREILTFLKNCFSFLIKFNSINHLGVLTVPFKRKPADTYIAREWERRAL